MGSSMVTIFIPGLWTCRRKAYKVVVFPEPVGPVLSIMPLGLAISILKISIRYLSNPNASIGSAMVVGSKTRITMVSA